MGFMLEDSDSLAIPLRHLEPRLDSHFRFVSMFTCSSEHLPRLDRKPRANICWAKKDEGTRIPTFW